MHATAFQNRPGAPAVPDQPQNARSYAELTLLVNGRLRSAGRADLVALDWVEAANELRYGERPNPSLALVLDDAIAAEDAMMKRTAAAPIYVVAPQPPLTEDELVRAMQQEG